MGKNTVQKDAVSVFESAIIVSNTAGYAAAILGSLVEGKHLSDNSREVIASICEILDDFWAFQNNKTKQIKALMTQAGYNPELLDELESTTKEMIRVDMDILAMHTMAGF